MKESFKFFHTTRIAISMKW